MRYLCIRRLALHTLLALACLAPATGMTSTAAPPAVMLAERYHEAIDPTGYWVSEKLDGVRAIWDGQQLRLRSDAQSQAAPINVQVVEPPSIPSAPAAPNRPILLSAVLVLALGAGIAAAFILGQIQTTFPTQSRLAAITGLPVLGTVSEVVTAPVRAARRRRLVWLGGTGAALAGCYAVLMLVEFWQRAQVA